MGDPFLSCAWIAVASSDSLEEGCVRPVKLLEEELVLWRGQGVVHAWQDLCVHRGAKLSLGKVKQGRLVCRYHGWEYDADGRCVHIPAHPEMRPSERAKVKAFWVEERYGLIWVSLNAPTSEIPEFKEWEDAGFRKIFCGPYHYKASAPRVVENFLDVTHFPYVHAGLLGDENKPEVSEFVAERVNGKIVAKDIKVWQPDPDGFGKGAIVSYTYECLNPLTAKFSKRWDDKVFVGYLTTTPVTQTETIAWIWLALNYDFEVPEQKIREFQDSIVKQDIEVVESQRPEKLPLDLSAELHLKSDRIAIAYRKWLKELGLTFGTS